ncbi:hypothetical protein, partial [Escherichia coli]|uniref:hypothetical protein n=1 Tax=Escherichia coli TaxID=562 RepID=UPI00396C40F1
SHSYLCSWGFTHLPRDSAFWPHPFGASASAVQNAMRFVLQRESFSGKILGLPTGGPFTKKDN